MATILVVDDEEFNRKFLSVLLSYAGHRVVEAADGADGLAQARAEKPGLVIADILMPRMDGYEFVRRLRDDPEIARTRVIFYTAFYQEREARSLAETCGVRHLLTKPSDPRVVLSTVNEALDLPSPALGAAAPEDFDRRHSHLLTDKLSETVAERRQMEESFRTLFEETPVGTVLAGPDRRLQRVNRAICEMLGYTGQELLALRVDDVTHPEDLPGSLAALEAVFRGEAAARLQSRYIRKTGEVVWAETTPALIRNQAGTAHCIAVIENITERKRSEEQIRHLNQALEERVAELTAVNQDLEAFTSSAAHDLRAPLRHIDGWATILLEEAGPGLDPASHAHLRRILEVSQELARMIDGLLSLAQTGRREPNKLLARLNPLVEEALQEFGSEIAGREIEWRIGELPCADCDPALMKLVFANLLSNAIKFTRPRAPAIIEIGRLPGEGPPVIFVRDNGAGFSMKHAGKLFGLFQRLHRREDFEGTGIGLATVQRIIQKHGGRIWAEAQPNQGATFYFTLG